MTPNLSQHPAKISGPQFPTGAVTAGWHPAAEAKRLRPLRGYETCSGRGGQTAPGSQTRPGASPAGNTTTLPERASSSLLAPAVSSMGGAMCTPTLKIQICKTKHRPGLPVPPRCRVPRPQHQGLCVHPPALPSGTVGRMRPPVPAAAASAHKGLGDGERPPRTSSHQLHRTAEVPPPRPRPRGRVVVSENPAKSLKSRIRCQLK